MHRRERFHAPDRRHEDPTPLVRDDRRDVPRRGDPAIEPLRVGRTARLLVDGEMYYRRPEA